MHAAVFSFPSCLGVTGVDEITTFSTVDSAYQRSLLQLAHFAGW
jgi:hypothetical protein